MSEKKRHIVFLTPGFAASESDTACLTYLQKYVLAYRQEFSEDRLSIITFQYPFKSQQYVWHDIEIFSAGGKNRFFPFRFITWFRVIRRFKKLNGKFPVTAIHSFWLHDCTFLGQYLTKRYRLKHIATTMGQDSKKGNRYLPWINPSRLKLVALSEFSSGQLLKNYGIKADFVIPFGESRDEKGIPKNERRIDLLGVGSIVPVKNYSLFVEIVAELKKDFPNIRCVISGSTSAHPEQTEFIRKLIEQYQVKDNITLAGFVSDQELENYMLTSKIFLHPSLYEGQSQVCLEALYFGLTVVRFNTGYIAAKKTIACNNKAEIIEAVRKLLSERSLTFESYVPIRMKDTVKNYYQLY